MTLDRWLIGFDVLSPTGAVVDSDIVDERQRHAFVCVSVDDQKSEYEEYHRSL